MNLSHDILPAVWLWAGLGAYLLAMGPALYLAPWKRLRENEYSHVYLGACVTLLVLWSMHTRSIEGIEYHYLGATLLTLMFGWQLALIGMSAVLLGGVLGGSSDWQAFPLNLVIMGVVPVFASQAVFFIVDRRLPNHFMTYIFLGAFFGAGLALGTAILMASAVLTLSGATTFQQLLQDYLPFAPLMVFPEAIITGMAVTAMVGLRPTWVSTFDDDRYLKGK